MAKIGAKHLRKKRKERKRAALDKVKFKKVMDGYVSS